MAGLGGLAGFIAGRPIQAYQQTRLGEQKVDQGDVDAQGQQLLGLSSRYLFGSQVPGAQPMGQTPTQQGMLQTLIARLQGGGPPPSPSVQAPGPGMGQSPGGPVPGGPPPSAVPGARPMPMPQARSASAPGPSADPNNPQNWTGAQWDTPQGPQGMTFAQRFAVPGIGAPPQQSGMPSSQPPVGGGQTLPMQGVQSTVTLQSAMGAIQKAIQANPSLNNPRAIARALSGYIPLMQADQREQALQVREYIANQREQGLNTRALENIAGRQGVADTNAASRETVAGMRPEVQAFHNFMEQNPNATPDQQAKFITSYKGGAAGNPNSATAMRFRAADQEKEAVLSTIDDTLGTIQKASKAGLPVAGLAGKGMRVTEVIQTLRGIDATLAHQFEQQIEILRTQLPRILAGSRVSNKEDRARIDKIVPGLELGSTAPITVADLQYLKTVIKRMESGQGGAAELKSGGNADFRAKAKAEGYSDQEIDEFIKKQGGQ